MKFKKLSKEKRQHLMLVALVSVAVLGSLGFGLLRTQYASLERLAAETDEAGRKLSRMKLAIQQADEIETELAEARQNLAAVENAMGTGDLYSWGLDLLRRFRAGYKVEVPAIGQPVVGVTPVLPTFPYQQAAFTLGGTAYYHDLGVFIADFENQFPYLRIVNLSLDPTSSQNRAEAEKLEFKMDVVALVRPNQN